VRTMRGRPDKRTRPAAPGAFGKVTSGGTPTTSVADKADAVVVELAERRARRLLADLDLAPTVPVPCGPCCTCYGRPMGSGCGS
jgi:xanthine/CO dehydrogenase XdhC/CoxF family maturation factor